MKVHYINILLFALPLNILEHNQKNHKIPTPHTPKIPIIRLLCECELYAPSNYDSDPQMKAVMDNFNKKAQERFHEYDERMKTTRQKCKDQCDKEIQKIILKDKLEKELMNKFATLQTDIQSDAIPTCVCEKSLADKVEKTCLKCGGVLGGSVTPAWGFLSGIVYTGWKAAALAAATKEAIAEGAAKGLAAGTKAGIKTVMNVLGSDFGLSTLSGKALGSFFDAKNYNNVSNITTAIFTKYKGSCLPPAPVTDKTFCNAMWSKFVPNGYVLDRDAITNAIEKKVETIVSQAKTVADAAAETAAEEATNLAMETNTAAVNATYASSQTAIIASVVAILVIVLVMIIIYLILRYRRKKKMKKKLQYIKLLEE